MLLNKTTCRTCTKSSWMLLKTQHSPGVCHTALPVTAAPEAARRPQWPITDSAPENQREVKGQKFINQPYQLLPPAKTQEIASPLCPCQKEIETAIITQQGKGGYQKWIRIDCIFYIALCLNSLKNVRASQSFSWLKMILYLKGKKLSHSKAIRETWYTSTRNWSSSVIKSTHFSSKFYFNLNYGASQIFWVWNIFLRRNEMLPQK